MVPFYEKLVEILSGWKVKQVYGVPGDAINPLVDVLRTTEGIDFIHVNHEEGGAFAASAAAKLTGRLQVCAGTVGPGAIHLLNGLYDARKDHAPVLAIVGQVPTARLGTSFHQEVDLPALFEDVAGFLAEIRNPAQLISVGREACRYAVAERSVAVLVIPHDVGSQKVEDFPVLDDGEAVARTTPNAEPDRLRELVDAVAEAEAPTFLVGDGVRGAEDAVLALAERWQAPVIRTLKAKDLVPDDFPNLAGGLGLLGDRGGVRAMSDADLLIMLGTDFPYSDWYQDDCPAYQIDTRVEALGRRRGGVRGIQGDVGNAARWLLDHTETREDGDHLDEVRSSRDRWNGLLEHWESLDRSDEVVHPQAVARLLGELAADDAIFTCDTGIVTVWGARHLHLRKGQRFTLSANLGSMAYALPAAIGAQFSHPDRQVIALAGDGGFNMLMGEFLTAVKYDLPVKIVVFNNRKLGLIQMEQEAEGFPESETELQNPEYAPLARAMGGEGWEVSVPGDLRDTLEEALRSRGPALIDVRVNSDELSWPPSIDFKQAAGFGIAKVKELFQS